MPNVVYISGRPIKIKQTDKIVAGDGPGKYMDAAGTTNWKAQRIEIVNTYGYDEVVDTFVHETLHALIAAVGVDLDLVTDEALEEKIVSRVTPALLNFIRDNPKAIEYITNRRVLAKGSVQ